MEIIQPDRKIGSHSLSCELIEGSHLASHIEDFNPIKEFPEVFPEETPLELPPLREGFDCCINLIDENKKMNPATIPVPPKWMSDFHTKIQQDLQAEVREGPRAVRDLWLRGHAGRAAGDQELGRQGQRPSGRDQRVLQHQGP